jgi:hypothetical protein
MWCLLQKQIGVDVYLWDPISNKKIASGVIHGLHGNKIGDQIVPIDHVAVQVKEVFIPNVIVPHSELSRITKLKESEGCRRIWSAKFLKLAHPQRGN